MKTLGIAIKSTLQGSGEAIKINSGKWDSKIVDIRDVLRHVPSLSTDPNRSIIFLSFSDEGSYITVARCFPAREGDNIAGWIFVPNDILISGDEVCHIVDEVRNIIFNKELPSKEKLDEIFSKQYPIKAASIPCKASPKNGKFAKREITAQTPLNVLLGRAIYQPAYDQYQDVFITQFKDEVTDATDLTAQPLTQMVTLQPPAPEALTLAGQGTVVYVAKTNEVFDKPLMVPKGSLVELKAVRNGYSPESFSIRVEGESVRCPLPKFLWKPVAGGGASGIDVGQPDLPTWNIELANGETAQIMIKGGGVSRGTSPLKGYELIGRKTLEYKSGSWTDRFIGFGAAIVLGLVVCGILALSGTFGGGKKEVLAQGEDTENVDENGFPTAEGSADFSGWEEAVKYLDSNNNWTKEGMAKYKELNGLFDALNTFDLTSVTGTWKTKLAKSQKFQALVQNAEICLNNNYPARENKAGNVWDENGQSISVIDYENWINKQCANVSSTPSVSAGSSSGGYSEPSSTPTYSGGGGGGGSLNVRQAPAGGVKKTPAPNSAANQPQKSGVVPKKNNNNTSSTGNTGNNAGGGGNSGGGGNAGGSNASGGGNSGNNSNSSGAGFKSRPTGN